MESGFLHRIPIHVINGPHQICIGIQTAAAPSFPVIPKVFDALVFFSDAPDPVISPVAENRPVSVGILKIIIHHSVHPLFLFVH